MIRRLVKEVRGLNPTFDAADIHGPFNNYLQLIIMLIFVTEADRSSVSDKMRGLKRTGKDVEKKRRHERITRVGLIQILIIKFTVRHQMN